jgi:predicted esterase
VSAERRVPVRLLAPPSAVRPGVRAPLIVALHGAGGDENMFVDAYGAGVITRLADSLGALVVSPLANGFTAAAFDSVVAVVQREYSVDSTRLYVVGHSMGAGITAMLANTRGARLAAVAAVAGGAPITAVDAPPALFIAGGVDPVIPAARVQAAADATRAAGRTMEYRVLPSEGHTLIVGRVLPDAIAWLFTKSR